MKSGFAKARGAQFGARARTSEPGVEGPPAHAQFRAQARRTPDADAVRGLDEALTFAELDQRSDRLADRLRALGVGRDVPVGLCIDRSAALIVAALGIMKAGGAYVALDPASPAERLAFMLRDSGAPVVITARAGRQRLAGVPADVTTVIIDEPAAARSRQPVTPAEIDAGPDDLAYVIYTSGSTGVPKGVEVTHGSLVNLIGWHGRAFGVTEHDRATLFASPGFDAAVWELWPNLCAGACIHVVDPTIRRDPVAIRDWLVAQRITHTFLPTALAEVVMSLAWPQSTALRRLLTGGETLHRHPPPGLPFQVVNNYGPTEATVVTTSGVVAPAPDPSSPPSIGRPISGVVTRIVDDQLNEVPAGGIGELLVGGPGVARGYRGRPQLTAERFLVDRDGRPPGGRLYRTGDLVRRRADGELEFHGRVDEQVQIRGHRVEPGEVSAVLRRHSGLRAAIVVATEPPDGARLLAYVVPSASPPTQEQLRDHAAAHLPDYMVPTAFIVLDELPLTASGKIDHDRLPAPVDAVPAAAVRPRDELERVLEQIVAELLQRDEVGVEENFFMLGGHSLLGAQLIARIGGRFGVEMTLRGLFDNPTVAAMAGEVTRLLTAEIAALSDADAARLLAIDAANARAGAPDGAGAGP